MPFYTKNLAIIIQLQLIAIHLVFHSTLVLKRFTGKVNRATA